MLFSSGSRIAALVSLKKKPPMHENAPEAFLINVIIYIETQPILIVSTVSKKPLAFRSDRGFFNIKWYNRSIAMGKNTPKRGTKKDKRLKRN